MEMEENQNIEPAIPRPPRKKRSNNYYDRIMRLQITSTGGEVSRFQSYTKQHHFTSDYEWKVNKIDSGDDFEIQFFNSVSDIVSAEEFLFVVSIDIQKCLVFIEGGDRRVRLMEGVVDVVYNPYKHAVMVLYEDEEALFILYSIPLELIQSSERGTELFGREYDIDFFQIDVINCRGIVFSTTQAEFKVFELNEYRVLFTIPDPRDQLKMGFGSFGNKHMLFYSLPRIRGPRGMDTLYNVKLYSRQDGTIVLEKEVCLRDEAPPLNWNRDDIALSGEKLVVRGGHWIVDIYNCSNQVVVTSNSVIAPSLNTMYLHRYNSFLAFFDQEKKVGIWELDNGLKPDGAPHWFLEAPHNLLAEAPFLSEKQDIFITCCDNPQFAERGIYVCNLQSRQVVCKIEIPMTINALGIVWYDERNHQIFASGDSGLYRWRPFRVERQA